MGLFNKRDPDGPPAYENHGAPPPPEKGDKGSRLSMTPQPVAGPSHAPLYACILLSRDDRIRLLNFPPHVTDLVRQTLAVAWPVGLQADGPYGPGTHEFKLKGNPWYGQGREAVPAKRLMIHILHALSNNGWHLSASTDLSKKSWDKDSLIFRAGPPVNRLIFSITFNETDKIRIIDAPTDQIQQAFIQTVHDSWPNGIQDSKVKEERCYQIKLRGNPWYASSGTQVTDARVLALNLMTVFDHLGYELMATIDMNTGNSDDGRDIDAWFFGAKLHF